MDEKSEKDSRDHLCKEVQVVRESKSVDNRRNQNKFVCRRHVIFIFYQNWNFKSKIKCWKHLNLVVAKAFGMKLKWLNGSKTNQKYDSTFLHHSFICGFVRLFFNLSYYNSKTDFFFFATFVHDLILTGSKWIGLKVENIRVCALPNVKI